MSNRINWRHPLRERPKNEQGIYYIDWHWKLDEPGSFQIIGGYYREDDDGGAGVWEDDFHGSGCRSYDWPLDEEEMEDCNHVGGWVPKEEIDMPEWLLGGSVGPE